MSLMSLLWMFRRCCGFVVVTVLAVALTFPFVATAQRRPIIVQTNAAGDNVHLIDPETNTIVGEITGVEVIHGVAASPDGSKLYLSNESTEMLDIVDVKTLKVTNSIPLSGRPNNVAIHNDGHRVYVAIQGTGGGVDVIDTVNEEHVKFIRILRGVHNTFMTPDSKYVVAGSTGGGGATAIDTEFERTRWTIYFEGRCDPCGVRPFTFDTNPDGSTKNMYVQVTNHHGFAVVDWDSHQEIARITQPEIPESERNAYGIQGAPAHGIKVSPDGSTIWSTSKINGHVYAYSLPDLEYLGGVPVGVVPDWLTFTPDGKYLYSANAHSNTVSVIDVEAIKEVKVISVGQVPKRNITAMLPSFPSGQ